MVVLEIVERARQHGVLEDAWSVKRPGKKISRSRAPSLLAYHLPRRVQPALPDKICHGPADAPIPPDMPSTPPPAKPPMAPSIFHNLKWKTDDFGEGGGT